MRNSKRLTRLADLCCLGGLAFVIFFPFIISCTLLREDALPRLLHDALSGFGLTRLLEFTFLQCDSGGQMEVGGGMMRLAVLFAALCWLLLPRSCERGLRAVTWSYVAFLGLSGLACIFSGHLRDSLTDWADQFGFFLCFLLSAYGARSYLHSLKAVRSTVYCLVAVALGTVLNCWLGFIQSKGITPAMFGSFFQPNMLACYCLMVLPMVAFPLWHSAQRSGKPEPATEKGAEIPAEDATEEASVEPCANASANTFYWNTLTPYGLGLALSMLLVTIYLTCNRSAWTAAALGVALIAALYPVWTPLSSGKPNMALGRLLGRALVSVAAVVLLLLGVLGQAQAGLSAISLCWVAGLGLIAYLAGSAWREKRFWLTLGLVVLLSGCWTLILSPTQSNDSQYAQVRVQSLASGQDNSAAARSEFYLAAWRMACDHPLLGVGPRGFHRAYPRYQTDFRWYAKSPHSLLLQLLCEYGFLATGVFLVILWFGCRGIYAKLSEDEDERLYYRLGLALAVVLFLVHAQFDVDVDFATLPLLASLYAGLAIGIPSRPEQSQAELEQADQSQAEQPQAEQSQANKSQANKSQAEAKDIVQNLDYELAEFAWSVRPSMLWQYGASLVIVLLIFFSAWAIVGEYFFSCGKYAQEAGEKGIALQCYREATMADPYQGEYERRAAELLMELYRTKQEPAILDELNMRTERAVSLDSTRPSVWGLRGRVLELKDKWLDAEPCYLRALELDPVNYPSVYTDVARMLVKHGKTAEAKKVLDEAILRFPTSAFKDMFEFRSQAIVSMLADLYVNKALLCAVGDPERLNALNQAYALDPRSQMAKMLLATEALAVGRILESNSQLERARPFYQRSAALLKELYQQDPKENTVRSFYQAAQEHLAH